ncbi:hypothetical protein AA12717_1049 [Gluconacetobacter sacchari DSM 12717]|uniref:DUF2946 domain-containing protein n=1 Tax=Gluconacetobacter sacchari DSM 12717 TaxID=1307940 RepID=A0ABQ0P4T9_9PROT|nr:DUF2946 domain-containing protein [Gluconacetobacter sacchari]GBQ21963.1 hypothetical protein AA12717_1049 [Gluconacetobacter sacchari DSM 12717]
MRAARHRISSPGRRLAHALRGVVVLATLLGLLGQLALQSQARLDEMPRATFERLTGLHIGFPSREAHAHAMRADMPDMSMGDMPGPHRHHDGGYCPLCPLLHLPSIVLATPFMAISVAVRVDRTRHVLPPAHAPPSARGIRLPPPTGPPFTA